MKALTKTEFNFKGQTTKPTNALICYKAWL